MKSLWTSSKRPRRRKVCEWKPKLISTSIPLGKKSVTRRWLRSTSPPRAFTVNGTTPSHPVSNNLSCNTYFITYPSLSPWLMIAELNDDFWLDLLVRIHEGEVVPVVGPGAVTIGRRNELLYPWLAQG